MLSQCVCVPIVELSFRPQQVDVVAGDTLWIKCLRQSPKTHVEALVSEVSAGRAFGNYLDVDESVRAESP